MKCPKCLDVELASVPYEGIAVMLCPKCHGFLASKTALRAIEGNPEMETAVLAMETEDMSDTLDALKCPKCKIGMEKRSAPHGLDFNLDVCDSCGLIWLDHGELEAIQIAFEETPGGKDMLERRKMMNEMSDERREALNANIAKARDRLPNTTRERPFDLVSNEYRGRGYSILGALIDSFFNL